MKNTIIILILSIFINCKAQTPIIPLIDRSQSYGQINGAYYKDVENFLNNFEGTWVWQDGNSALTFVFEKIESYHNTPLNANFYEDLLVGEFKYVENGVVIADYLADMNSGNLSRERNISGNSIIYRGWFPKCDACPNDELRIRLHFTDPERPFRATLVLRHGIQWWNQQEFIEARLFVSGTYTVSQGDPTGLRVPDGIYTLLKQ
jgi:hypothetical protein